MLFTTASDTRFPNRCRFGGNFKLKRLQVKTKVQIDVLDELLYADDMDKNASSEAKIQRAMDQVSQLCENYDLAISPKKTDVVLYTHQHLEKRTMNHLSL